MLAIDLFTSETGNLYPISHPIIVSLEDDDAQGWSKIQSIIRKLGFDFSEWAVAFLRDGLQRSAKSVLIEPHYICKDHSSLHHQFYSKKFAPRGSHCCRMHFFTETQLDPNTIIFNAAEYQNGYIGYVVIRPVSKASLGTMILDPSKIGQGIYDGCYVLSTIYTVHVYGSKLTIKGFPYLPPDGDAMLCGHTALWSICRYLSQKRTRYGEFLPFDILELAHREQGRLLPNRPTGTRDYSAILSEFGTHPIVVDMQVETISGAGSRKLEAQGGSLVDKDSFRDVCTYIESGVPVIASFGGHALVLIGHTLDFSRPPHYGASLEEEWLIDHSSYFGSLVASDGSRFPYSRLTFKPPMSSVDGQTFSNRRYIEDIKAVVCPLPEKVYLAAASARNIALCAVKIQREAIEQLCGKTKCVTRLLFTTCSAFKNFKRRSDFRARGGNHLAGFVTSLHLPHFVWLMELGELDVYKNGAASVEVLIDASAGPLDNAVIYMRIGDVIHYKGVKHRLTGCSQHLPLFTHNLGQLS